MGIAQGDNGTSKNEHSSRSSAAGRGIAPKFVRRGRGNPEDRHHVRNGARIKRALRPEWSGNPTCGNAERETGGRPPRPPEITGPPSAAWLQTGARIKRPRRDSSRQIPRQTKRKESWRWRRRICSQGTAETLDCAGQPWLPSCNCPGRR